MNTTNFQKIKSVLCHAERAMSQREISFADVTKETDASHAAMVKAAETEARQRAAEARAEAARIEREKQRIQIAYEKEQKAKAQEAARKKKVEEEENERLRLELQISLYREQYPDLEIERTTERTPLTKLREIKKKVEAKNALTFMPPMLHMVGGMVIKLYEKMVVEMEMNPFDHEVRGLRQFYMSAVARQIMMPAWKATVAANPGLLVGGNPWYMQVLMGFYMVAEANSQRMRLMQSGAVPTSLLREDEGPAPPEDEKEDTIERQRGPPPRMRAQSQTPVHSALRENLLRMARENEGKGKGKEKM